MYGQGMGFSNWLCGAGGFMPGPFGMIFTVLIWVVVIGLIISVFQYFFSAKKRGGSSSSLTILKDRYAAGEISKQNFEQMKRDIA